MNMKSSPERIVAEWGDNIIVVTDHMKRGNFFHWRGELYFGECFAFMPMPTQGVEWFKQKWTVHFCDYEGDSVTADFDLFTDAIEFVDKHAPQMLRGYLVRRGLIDEDEELNLKGGPTK